MALALGIFGRDAHLRLNLTTATLYHATGLSQSESITCRQAVAISTIIPSSAGGAVSQRETCTIVIALGWDGACGIRGNCRFGPTSV